MADNISPEQRAAENAKPTIELGTSGLMQFGGQIEEAYLTELRYPQAYTKYNEMRRRDPTIGSLFNAIKLLMRNSRITTEAGGTSDADKQANEFLAQNLEDMSITITNALEDLFSAIPFGWATSEIVYKRRSGPTKEVASKYDDGRIGWRKWAPRRQSSFEKWQFDANGGMQGWWQTARTDGGFKRVFLPIGKCIHFTADRDMGNPEGFPILENIYEPWHYVKNLQIILGIGYERAFVGLPKFTYGTPENPYTPSDDDKALVNRIGRQIRVDEKAFISLPGNIGFELITTDNPSATSILDTIRQYRIWMLMTVLADFLALGTLATGGSYALGQDKSELFLMAVDGWLDKLVEVLNLYAVPRLFAYNDFGALTELPHIVHSSVQKPNLPAVSAYLASLTAYITPDALLEAELRRVANLPEAENPENREPEPAADDTETGDKVEEGEDAADAEKLSRRPSRQPNYRLRSYERQFNAALSEYHRLTKAAL